MRKLREGGEKVGAQALEVAALMSRAASLWRALGGDPLARLRGVLRLEGTRRLVADDDGALLALAVAEMAGACADLARAVARLAAGKCHDPLLRHFGALFGALVSRSPGADAHGLRYAQAKKMDRKARKMQRLVCATGRLFEELDVLAELDQAAARLRRPRQQQQFSPGEAARRAERQRREVERLRGISLWSRSFDYAVRLLARSLFTVVARIIEVFDLQPPKVNDCSSVAASLADRRLSFSWSNSFSKSLVYPSDFGVDTPPRSSKSGNNGDVRRFLVSRSQSLRQQLKWPAVPGKNLVGCMVGGGRSKSSPSMEKGWIHVHGAGGGHDLPLSFSYASSSGDEDDFDEGDHTRRTANTNTKKLSTSVFESSSQDVLANAPETTLGATALASHYASLIVFLEKLAVSPRHICPDERDALYGMLTANLRASLRSRLRPPFSAIGSKKKKTKKKNRGSCYGDPVLAAEWADTVEGILGWLAPLAHNTVRWRSERSFEQRHVGGGGSGVLLLQTLHFADREKTEAAITELLVGLNHLWRHGTELCAARAKLESTGGGDVYHDCKDYIG
ncbi:uncharacterized protein LOC100824242 [Brachypodium distachyon]|uniref:DUF668 domain-containing protein n=1 Tax=Brachypodium distachyon TaxID=15368 RepID=I1IUF5_BRADI|nr:uncharacterized protein LOC100824242 [Brachypodium distachyon]PNT65457.1 hypothetical protein BRADI_4g42760v3 [Brachypodium distachyon]|eukprot:XP_003578921.1 uncharacterized protein LOC100824242 [Brachypodium distachyon]